MSAGECCDEVFGEDPQQCSADRSFPLAPGFIRPGGEGDCDQFVVAEKSAEQPIIAVVAHVADLIRSVHELGLERHGPAGVLEETLEDLLLQVQAGERAAMFFKERHDPVRLLVVLEAVYPEPCRRVLAHPRMEGVFAAVAEGRMSEIVRERDALGQILIEPQRPREVSADLCDLHRVREAGAEMVSFTRRENLRFALESSECLRVKDPIAIALERKAHRVLPLGVHPAERAFVRDGEGGEELICLTHAIGESFHASSLREGRGSVYGYGRGNGMLFLMKRDPHSHKGENGKVAIIGGSAAMHGAPLFSALAAEATGADVIYVCVPRCHEEIAKHQSLNFQVHPFTGDELSRRDLPMILELLATMDSAVVGPGLSHSTATLRAIREIIAAAPCPLVIDASALQPWTMELVVGRGCVVTPHEGELERMGIRPGVIARVAKEFQITILVKGPTDRIAHPNGTIEEVMGGNPGLTVGGTGDALAGLTAGLLAQHASAADACRIASTTLKAAGDELAETHGYAYGTRRVIERIPMILKRNA